jgi:hypothetical protein
MDHVGVQPYTLDSWSTATNRGVRPPAQIPARTGSPAPTTEPRSDVTLLVERWSDGEDGAFDHLMELVYARCRLGRAVARQGRASEAERLMLSALETMRAQEGVPASEIQLCEEALEGVWQRGVPGVVWFARV